MPFVRSRRPTGRDGSTVGQLLAARLLRGAVHVDDLVDRAEPRSQPVYLGRPLDGACCDGGTILGAERSEREPDGREIRAGVERVAELLEEDRLLDEAEPDAAVLL